MINFTMENNLKTLNSNLIQLFSKIVIFTLRPDRSYRINWSCNRDCYHNWDGNTRYTALGWFFSTFIFFLQSYFQNFREKDFFRYCSFPPRGAPFKQKTIYLQSKNNLPLTHKNHLYCCKKNHLLSKVKIHKIFLKNL